MGILIPLGTVILAALVHATLQLDQGCLLLLYHASLGKFVKKKTRELVGSFISGVGIILFLLMGTTGFLISAVVGGLPKIALTILGGVLVALSTIVWFFYHRRGKTTELWLPRKFARFINQRAEAADNDTEAFLLGVLSSFGELPFSLPLILVAMSAILEAPIFLQSILLVLYILVAIMPLIIMRLAIRRGQTVVDIQRWRVKNKNFLRTISGIGFLTLAMFLLVFKLAGA